VAAWRLAEYPRPDEARARYSSCRTARRLSPFHVVRDSDLLELAAVFLSSGSQELFAGDDDARDYDVVVDLFFETGYTLDQVTASLDTLDGVLTAGFIAAEARESERSPAEILGRLVSRDDPLDITWEVDFVEPGTLRIKAIVKRSGAWMSKHKGPTIWVLGGAGLFVPLLGVPALVAGGIAWGAAGAVGSGAYMYDRSVQRKKAAGNQEVPGPVVTLAARPAEDGGLPKAPMPPEEPDTDVYDVIVDGDDASNWEFMNRLNKTPSVEFTKGPNAGRVRVWSADPIEEPTFRRLAEDAGTTLVRVEILPRVYLGGN
jgi:hypothetical protein